MTGFCLALPSASSAWPNPRWSTRHLESEIAESRLGQILAFLIGVFTIGCGTYAATHGAEIAGGFIGAGGVVGLVTAFIMGRKRWS